MDCKNISGIITQWLKDYAVNAGVKGFVVGISGGVDSALVSTLCAETGLNVKCIMMPIHQHPDHMKRAYEHIEFLKSKYKNQINSCVNDLTETFEQFNKTVVIDQDLAQIYDNEKIIFHLANTRARLRMTNLYFHAGISGYLVAGTGNKVEDFGIGFFTKYGDGGVDISPIGDLYKSEVYELAKYLGIPKSIQDAVPTDGLFGDSRSDEDQIGATYDELEWAMKEEERLEDEVFPSFCLPQYSPRGNEVLRIYNKRHNANAHKMQMPPVCILK